MDQILVAVGISLLVAGVVVAIATSFHGTSSKSVRGGAVVLIGPIPIIFGSDSRTVRLLIILAVILFATLIAFSLWQV